MVGFLVVDNAIREKKKKKKNDILTASTFLRQVWALVWKSATKDMIVVVS